LFLDTDAPWPQKTTYIGTDNITAGKTGGEALATVLQKGDKVALICGALGNPTTDERMRGAKQALEEAKMQIVAEQPADSDKAKAMSATENILQTHPDIKGIFAANDEMAMGALRAVKEEGVDVKVIGTDGTIEAIQSILQGDLWGTVAQNPYMMGYKAVENALKKLKGERVDTWINSGVEMIERKNAAGKLAFLKRVMGSR
jgi:ribose transport system substrate-binding protein